MVNGPSASTASTRSVFRAARGSSAVWAREVTSSFTGIRVASRSVCTGTPIERKREPLPRENAVGGDLHATGAEILAGKCADVAVRRLRRVDRGQTRPDEVSRDEPPGLETPVAAEGDPQNAARRERPAE